MNRSRIATPGCMARCWVIRALVDTIVSIACRYRGHHEFFFPITICPKSTGATVKSAVYKALRFPRFPHRTPTRYGVRNADANNPLTVQNESRSTAITLFHQRGLRVWKAGHIQL